MTQERWKTVSLDSGVISIPSTTSKVNGTQNKSHPSTGAMQVSARRQQRNATRQRRYRHYQLHRKAKLESTLSLSTPFL
ncbi:hypothetical protein F2P81_002254 [Scophthalmus maximus]|uniref:Uncharacterized protein n=1 Tax=Scophthalmus maximus TaxID=52904 RepID=A0A6A4TKI3_SCOMX|nr:hypothetical protein F2P81_002254 [Scophthalmus maximus]